jgi:prevent-host-death family protein
MIATLRETKSRLSELVARAAKGEEVIITVRGQPQARLSPVVRELAADRAAWMTELRGVQRRYATGKTKGSGTAIVSALREERQ